MSFKDRIPEYVSRTERSLERWLPATELHLGRLHEAMRYSVLGGGKRIRPLIVYATAETLGVPADQVDGPAVALELIHAYSLVHDDLPAMDDDDLRRGRPTTHRAFDEATAILVGDALFALAFTILAEDESIRCAAAARVDMLRELARACGPSGLTGGQVMDLSAEGQRLDRDALEDMYARKTAELIRAGVMLACHASERLDAAGRLRLSRFGHTIGVAFQIRDDILDIEGATEVIGKQQGADVARGKATFPALFGIAAAKQRVDQLYAEAIELLESHAERAEPLRTMADFIVHRST